MRRHRTQRLPPPHQDARTRRHRQGALCLHSSCCRATRNKASDLCLGWLSKHARPLQVAAAGQPSPCRPRCQCPSLPRALPRLACQAPGGTPACRPASATQLGVRGVAHLAPHASPATHRTKATQAWIPKTAWAATGADPLFLLEQPSPAIVDHEMLSQSKAQAPALRTTPAHFPQPVVRASAAASGRRAY